MIDSRRLKRVDRPWPRHAVTKRLCRH